MRLVNPALCCERFKLPSVYQLSASNSFSVRPPPVGQAENRTDTAEATCFAARTYLPQKVSVPANATQPGILPVNPRQKVTAIED